MLRKDVTGSHRRPSSRPLSSIGVIGPPSPTRPFSSNYSTRASENSRNPFSLNEEKPSFKQRPVSAKPAFMIKSQSVRTNLDKYKIEMASSIYIYLLVLPLIDYIEEITIFD